MVDEDPWKFIVFRYQIPNIIRLTQKCFHIISGPDKKAIEFTVVVGWLRAIHKSYFLTLALPHIGPNFFSIKLTDSLDSDLSPESG